MYYFVLKSKEKILHILTIFIITLTPIVFWQPFLDPFGPPQLMVIRVFGAFFILLFLFFSFKENKIKIKYSPFFLPAFIYILISFISIFFAINKEISFKYFTELVLVILISFVIYFISDRTIKKKIIFFILLSHFIISIYGILQHYDLDFFKWNTNFAGRPHGTIGNPDFLAGELLIPLFLLLSYSIFKKKYRQISIISFFLMFFCFILTKVVGAYIGFLAGIFCFIIFVLIIKKEKAVEFFKKYNLPIFIFLFLFSIFMIMFTPKMINIIKEKFHDKKRSAIHRLLMWEASLLMIKDYPLIGTGIGTYRIHYPYYQGILLNNPENKNYDYVVTWMPHQNYLLIASETGILGLGAFLLFLVVFFKLNYDLLLKNKILDATAIGICSGIVSLLIASLFNTFYNIPATTLLFFLLCIFQSENLKKEEIRIDIDKISKIIILSIFIIFFVFILISDGKTLLSNVYLKEANKLVKNKNFRQAIDYYEKIIFLKPVELTPQMDVGYYYFAAEAYRELGDIKRAKELYEMDLTINPFCPEVNNMLGATLGQLGDLENAIKRLKLAIFVAPHYEAAYTNLATAYIMKNDWVSAKNVLLEFLKKEPGNERIKNMFEYLEQHTKHKNEK